MAYAGPLFRKIAESFKLPYFTITPTFSICPIHGYLPGEYEYCPKCDVENEKGGEEWQELNVKSTQE